MPIFLDRHEMAGMTAEDIAEAHRADLATQGKFNVKFLTYWFDQGRGTGFCLIDAPDAETANRVHAEAHGGEAQHTIPVDMTSVYAFLGRVTDPSAAPKPKEFDSAYRAVMFTDIVNSTQLTGELGDQRAMEVVRTHDAFVRRALQENDGREVKHTGDGIMAALAEPRKALDCARQIQEQLHTYNQAAEQTFDIRIGIHGGEPVQEGQDLFGQTVQLAARLCGAAEPNSIVISEELFELTRPEAVQIGPLSLKGFAAPVRAFMLSAAA
jgi:class 3 adenylate cyclase